MPPKKKTQTPLDRLNERGRQLFDDLHEDAKKYDPLIEVMIVEACRIADRLERLDRIIEGATTEWIHFRDERGGDGVVVYVDNLLGEARNQATTVKGLISEITKGTTKEQPDEPAKPADPLEALRKARDARRGAATTG